MIKLRKLVNEESVEPSKSRHTIQLADEILNRTRFLQFEADQALVREINALVNQIKILHEG